jgi:hypothetical protein
MGDSGRLLGQLVPAILQTAGDLIDDVTIVSHAASSPEATKTLAELHNDGRLKVLGDDGSFNLSRQRNLAARQGSAGFLLFLNDDVAPFTADWLHELLLPFENAGVGLAGPLLLSPDESVQCAGLSLDDEHMPRRALRGERLPQGDYLFMTEAPREVSCLPGAAMVIKRSLFEDLNGFDPFLGVHLEDVDLSLRVGRMGRRLVFNPRSILRQSASAPPGGYPPDAASQQTLEREREHFVRRWHGELALDPFHNPNFSRRAEDLRTILVRP